MECQVCGQRGQRDIKTTACEFDFPVYAASTSRSGCDGGDGTSHLWLRPWSPLRSRADVASCTTRRVLSAHSGRRHPPDELVNRPPATHAWALYVGRSPCTTRPPCTTCLSGHDLLVLAPPLRGRERRVLPTLVRPRMLLRLRGQRRSRLQEDGHTFIVASITLGCPRMPPAARGSRKVAVKSVSKRFSMSLEFWREEKV